MTKNHKSKDSKKSMSEKLLEFKEKERIKNEEEIKKQEQRKKIHALNKLMTFLENQLVK